MTARTRVIPALLCARPRQHEDVQETSACHRGGGGSGLWAGGRCARGPTWRRAYLRRSRAVAGMWAGCPCSRLRACIVRAWWPNTLAACAAPPGCAPRLHFDAPPAGPVPCPGDRQQCPSSWPESKQNLTYVAFTTNFTVIPKKITCKVSMSWPIRSRHAQYRALRARERAHTPRTAHARRCCVAAALRQRSPGANVRSHVLQTLRTPPVPPTHATRHATSPVDDIIWRQHPGLP